MLKNEKIEGISISCNQCAGVDFKQLNINQFECKHCGTVTLLPLGSTLPPNISFSNEQPKPYESSVIWITIAIIIGTVVGTFLLIYFTK